MKYRNLADLAAATGFSRYTVGRAIESGLIRPEWVYRAPGSGRRKIHVEHFGQCVDALKRGWAPRSDSHYQPPQAPRTAAVETVDGELVAIVSLQSVADAAGVTLERVRQAIEGGEIPDECLVEVENSTADVGA